MQDARLRTLDRRARAGDPEAARALFRESLRTLGDGSHRARAEAVRLLEALASQGMQPLQLVQGRRVPRYEVWREGSGREWLDVIAVEPYLPLDAVELVSARGACELPGIGFGVREPWVRATSIGDWHWAQPASAIARVFASLARLTATLPGEALRSLLPEHVLVLPSGEATLTGLDTRRVIAAHDAVAAPRMCLSPFERFAPPLWFHSPESLFDGGVYTSATAVYGLGQVLYLILTGRAPREPEGSRARDVLRALEGPVRPPSELDPGVDPPLASAAVRMLALDPADRPSLGELTAVFDGIAAGPSGLPA